MVLEELKHLCVEQMAIPSHYLKRYVIVDIYRPSEWSPKQSISLLVINDGQDLPDMPFAPLLDQLSGSGQIGAVMAVGIHCNKDRRLEYGVAGRPDYENRGNRADGHAQFVTEELLPWLHQHYAVESFRTKAYAGFSLGGLSAMDTVWNHPDVFSIAGVFSGSLWWRSKPLGPDYNDDTDRIIHQVVKEGDYSPGLKFYFTTGSLDETADRNNNGVIDSIDDTLALIEELRKKGYGEEAVRYVNFADGKHDVPTWARALPAFLLWSFAPATAQQPLLW